MKARLGTGLLASLQRSATMTKNKESEEDGEYEAVASKKGTKQEQEIWKVLDFDG